jgi:hypothetical protein
MSRGSFFGFGLLTGFLGCAAVALLLRRFARREFYRFTGLEDEIRTLTERAKRKARERLAVRVVQQLKNVESSPASSRAEKHFVNVQLAVLALLNQESMSSKNFTFWRRRTSKIQADIDKLRIEQAHP